MLYSDVILEAYVALGVIQDTSETISTTLRDNALSVLNELLSSDSANRLMAYNVVHGAFAPVAGTATYTMGTGGVFTTAARPVAITGWKSTSGSFISSGEPVSFDVLRKAQQNQTGRRSVLPEMIAADQGFPSINLEIFPMPDTSPGALIIDYWTPLTAVAVGDTVTVPDGWSRYLVFGLASNLEPRFPLESGPRPEVARNYQEAKTAITARAAAILAPPQAQGA